MSFGFFVRFKIKKEKQSNNHGSHYYAKASKCKLPPRDDKIRRKTKYEESKLRSQEKELRKKQVIAIDAFLRRDD